MKTSRALSLMRAGLVGTAFTVLICTVWALQDMNRVVDGARTRTIPAILEITEARNALARADRAATAGFLSKQSELAGFLPGQEYQNQLRIANESLAQAAEDNSIGNLGSRTLQAVEGRLVTYTELIGQASADYRQDDTTLGLAQLADASQVMHHGQEGILAQLETLRRKEQERLSSESSAGWTDRAAARFCVASIALLLTLLVGTQAFLIRRFHRVVNVWLLLATVLVVAALSAGGWLARESRGHLEDGGDTLGQVVQARHDLAWRSARSAQGDLAELLSAECPGGCGRTVQRLSAGVPPIEAADLGNSVDSIKDNQRVNAHTESAQVFPDSPYLVIVAALAVILFVQLGLRKRLNDYRYQPK